jgi:hypothetical protein
MEPMIVCAMALVVLRWWTSAAPWRMANERVYDMIARRPTLAGAWPRLITASPAETSPTGSSNGTADRECPNVRGGSDYGFV